MMRVVDKPEAQAEVEKHIVELGTASRITITPTVIVSDKPPQEVIPRASANAAIVLLGFQTPEEGKELELYHRMESIAGDLPRVLFIASAGGMALES